MINPQNAPGVSQLRPKTVCKRGGRENGAGRFNGTPRIFETYPFALIRLAFSCESGAMFYTHALT